MRTLITGIRDGKSCVVREIDCIAQGEGLSLIQLLDLDLAALPSRPPGNGDFVDLGVSPGMFRWSRIRFQAGQSWAMHHTDTIDCHTIVAGAIDLILDDGVHHLGVGDCAVVAGVDHGWQVGPEGCETSVVLLGTPAPD